MTYSETFPAIVPPGYPSDSTDIEINPVHGKAFGPRIVIRAREIVLAEGISLSEALKRATIEIRG